jgi:phosphate acetyltransferase
MLAEGDVDGLVSGAIHSTANTIRQALQIIKTRPDAKAVSSVRFMSLPEQVLVYGDRAVIPDPHAGILADIAIQSADSAAAFENSAACCHDKLFDRRIRFWRRRGEGKG